MIHVPLPPNFDEVFLKDIDERIAAASGHILAGRCVDFASYRAECAKVVALKEIKDSFTALVSRLQKE